MHSMICQTDGIRSTAPVQWRSYEGMCAVHWEAQGEPGARGYYRSPDPRVMLFFNDVSHRITFSEQEAEPGPQWRPMLRALYVPAGVPMWTQFHARHEFSHLDLHLNRGWLVRRLAPMFGEKEAEAALRLPVEVQDVGALAALATALTEEIAAPSRGPYFAESLAIALLTGLIDPPQAEPADMTTQGGLTPNQMRRLRQLVSGGKGRLTNAELSQAVGLSEGWFCHAFKKTTGKTPLQWQQELRISMVKESLLRSDESLADIALRYDFSDQGHLTRVFRRYEGTTPSAWRREARAS
ncbi:helix-turn-helix transcriptional regulator [Vannielia sp. SX4]|uniref:helix-turn-helix transcriptional regulator n=1 Tax=Vannielia sp. SX4 TaxID=3463852 RepID=UPI004058015B